MAGRSLVVVVGAGGAQAGVGDDDDALVGVGGAQAVVDQGEVV